MRKMRYGRPIILLVLTFGLLVLGGCGKKTRPVPPDTVLPAKIIDLQYHLDEKGVALSWSYPTRTVTGQRLPYRLDGFELLRAVVPVADYCADCPVPFGPAIEIAAESGHEGKVTYQETLLRPKHRYIYRVRSRAGWFVTSDDSNTVSVVWDTPLQPPVDVRVDQGDRLLTLHWQPPAGLLDGTTIADPLRYQVYRAADGKNFSAYGEPVDGLEFADKNVRNGRSYSYRVRAIRLHEGTEAAGMASSTIVGVPQDLLPPVPPQHVTAVAVEQGVKIFWETVPEKDLAGFRIYRRSAKTAGPQPIGEVGGASLSFVDEHPPKASGSLYYSVTAFDRARPANESSASLEAVFTATE